MLHDLRLKMLAKKLNSNIPNNRIAAVRALGKIEDPRVADYLIDKTLESGDINVKVEAILILRELKDERIIELLIKMLKDSADAIRKTAAESLAIIGDQRAVEPLIQVLTGTDGWLRHKSNAELFRQPAPEKYNGDNFQSVNSAVLKALGKLKDIRAVNVLIEYLKNNESYIRNDAANALTIFDDDDWKQIISQFTELELLKNLEIFINALCDKDNEVNKKVASILTKISDLIQIESLSANTKKLIREQVELVLYGYSGHNYSFLLYSLIPYSERTEQNTNKAIRTDNAFGRKQSLLYFSKIPCPLRTKDVIKEILYQYKWIEIDYNNILDGEDCTDHIKKAINESLLKIRPHIIPEIISNLSSELLDRDSINIIINRCTACEILKIIYYIPKEYLTYEVRKAANGKCSYIFFINENDKLPLEHIEALKLLEKLASLLVSIETRTDENTRKGVGTIEYDDYIYLEEHLKASDILDKLNCIKVNSNIKSIVEKTVKELGDIHFVELIDKFSGWFYRD